MMVYHYTSPLRIKQYKKIAYHSFSRTAKTNSHIIIADSSLRTAKTHRVPSRHGCYLAFRPQTRLS